MLRLGFLDVQDCLKGQPLSTERGIRAVPGSEQKLNLIPNFKNYYNDATTILSSISITNLSSSSDSTVVFLTGFERFFFPDF